MTSRLANTTEVQSDPAGLDKDGLLTRCRERRRDGANESFCLELFRRAISGEDRTCWAILYENYKGMLCHWILSYASSVGHEVENLDALVVDALTAFWGAYSYEKFVQSRGLNGVLTYFKACAVSAVQQEIRGRSRADRENDLHLALEEVDLPAPGEHEPETLIASQIDAQRLWSIVRLLCHDESELLLAELSFSIGLKPAEIVARYPGMFANADEVYALLRNLRNRLRRNEDLRRLWTKTD